MRILALDLGVTSGWASLYLSKDGSTSPISQGTLSYAQFTAQLRVLLATGNFGHVVIEEPLRFSRGQLRDQLDNVVAWTMSAISDIPRTQVQPADWKQTTYAKLKVPRGLTTHERDAIRMGMWFAETRLQGC